MAFHVYIFLHLSAVSSLGACFHFKHLEQLQHQTFIPINLAFATLWVIVSVAQEDNRTTARTAGNTGNDDDDDDDEGRE